MGKLGYQPQRINRIAKKQLRDSPSMLIYVMYNLSSYSFPPENKHLNTKKSLNQITLIEGRFSVVPPFIYIVITNNTFHVRPITWRYVSTIMGAPTSSYSRLRIRTRK